MALGAAVGAAVGVAEAVAGGAVVVGIGDEVGVDGAEVAALVALGVAEAGNGDGLTVGLGVRVAVDGGTSVGARAPIVSGLTAVRRQWYRITVSSAIRYAKSPKKTEKPEGLSRILPRALLMNWAW